MAAERPHILAVAFPIPGHSNCLMNLCRSLVSPEIGLKITFATSEEGYEVSVRTRDLVAAQSSSLEEKIRVVSFGSFPTLDSLYGFGTKIGPVICELIQKLSDEGNPVVCLLSDTFNGWTQDVANKFNIPRAVLWTSNATNDVTHQFVPQLIEKGFVPVAECKKEELINFLPGLPDLHPKDLPLSFYIRHPALSVITEGAKRFPEAEFALCNTFEELEPDIIAAFRREVKANYYPIGPCLSPDFLNDNAAEAVDKTALSPDDIRCLEWLDKQQESSVIYVAFGSVASITLEQAQEVAKGLETAGKPFLFALRKNLVTSTESSTEFFDAFVKRTEDFGLVVPWAPQMQVLLHPSAGAFLTHCGWNSTCEALCSGVPLLGWPQWAEQNMNCKDIVHRWKIGIAVLEDEEQQPHRLVPSSRISSLVNRILGDEGKKLRSKARELRLAAKKAVSKGGSSHENLKAFAKAVRISVSRE